MDPAQDKLLAHLETDDTLTSYFRIRPLLSLSGDIRHDAQILWPENGCLRVVPDSQEGAEFRERLKRIGEWCMLDLTGIAPELPKIKTNRNYLPGNGNRCQYIVYSDVIQPLSGDTFCEVLEGEKEDFEALAEAAVTPSFYLKSPEGLFGPIQTTDPILPQEATEDAECFSILLPSGQSHVFLVARPVPGEATPQLLRKTLHQALRDQIDEMQSGLAGLQEKIQTSRSELMAAQEQLSLKAPKAMSMRLERLYKDCHQAQERYVHLQKEIQSLTDTRNAIYHSMAAFQPSFDPEVSAYPVMTPWVPMVLSGVLAQVATWEEMLSVLAKVCEQCGISFDRSTMIACLLLLANNERISLVTDDIPSVVTLARNLAKALGWDASLGIQTSEDERPLILPSESPSTPVILMTTLTGTAVLPGAVKVFIHDHETILQSVAYQTDPWPVLTVPSLPFVPQLEEQNLVPVALSSLTVPDTDTYRRQCQDILTPVHTHLCKLSGRSAKHMLQFAAAAAVLMDGGIAEACDWAVSLFLIHAIPGDMASIDVEKWLLDFPKAHAIYQARRQEN